MLFKMSSAKMEAILFRLSGLITMSDTDRTASLSPPTKSDGDIVLASVCTSVRTSICLCAHLVRFLSILRRAQGRNGPKCGIPMYADHLQKQSNFGQYWPNFGLLLAKNSVKLGFSDILRSMLRMNGLKCGMLMYPDHLQKWFDLIWPIRLFGLLL